jgi:hypothetical protein
MTQIVLTLLLSFFGLVLLFAFLWKAEGTGAKDHGATTEDRLSVAGLSAASVPHLDALLGKDDYSKLRTRAELKSVSQRFLRDRRRIALLWLDELQTDLRTLWEFRRFLVRNGLQVTLREEAGVASAALVALIYLEIARAAVSILGPFALSGAMRNAGLLLQLLSRRSVAPLSRVEAARRAEIEAQWAHHLLLQRAG